MREKKTWEYEWVPLNERPGLHRSNLRFRAFNLARTLWQLMLRWTKRWGPAPSLNVEANHVARSCHVRQGVWGPAVTPQHRVSFPMFSNRFFFFSCWASIIGSFAKLLFCPSFSFRNFYFASTFFFFFKEKGKRKIVGFYEILRSCLSPLFKLWREKKNFLPNFE